MSGHVVGTTSRACLLGTSKKKKSQAKWPFALSHLCFGPSLQHMSASVRQCMQEWEREDTAEQLQLLKSDELGGGELMLFQLPSILPTTRMSNAPMLDGKGQVSTSTGLASTSSTSVPDYVSLRDLPSGKVHTHPGRCLGCPPPRVLNKYRGAVHARTAHALLYNDPWFVRLSLVFGCGFPVEVHAVICDCCACSPLQGSRHCLDGLR